MMASKFSVFVKYGSNRDLSKLEISSLLERIKPKAISFQEWKQNLLLKLSENERGRFFKLLEHTGSIVKSGVLEIEKNIQQEQEWKLELRELLDKTIHKQYKKTRKQLKVSISIQSTSNEVSTRIHKNTQRIIRDLSADSDIPIKILKLKNENYEQTPFQYHKENMSRRGFEVTGFVIKSKVFFGITKWVTNPLVDIRQDEGRKVRFFTHGTSIKLVRSLVFLSQIQKGGKLLDPFCGTGTILLEGLNQGLEVIGVDKDPKCFRASKENLNQYTLRYPSKDQIKEKWKVFKQDSRHLSKILTDKVDAIITEPYLGPFLKELPEDYEAEGIMQDLEHLYISVLKASKEFLKANSKVVMIIPEYQYSTDLVIRPNIEKIAESSLLVLETESAFFSMKLPISIGRKHNIIGRKLAIFSKP
ncbi:MAG: TRM11 family SAM-dependent methyltransferase [Candidatus Heimdallarchaeaceae archaeon]